MNTKIERINKEIEKAKAKVNEHQARLRELEKQKTELENLDIVSAVRGMNISITDLAELLKNVRPDDAATSGHVGPKSARPETPAKPTAETPAETHEQEETE